MSDNGQLKAVGVDVGGTFTDLILLDPVAGDIHHQQPEEPADDDVGPRLGP